MLLRSFYSNENQEADTEQVQAETTTRAKAKPKSNQGANFVQDMQKGLQGSVRAVN